jgi:hypothetical protein
MNSHMDLRQHQALAKRAVELGRGSDPTSVPELIGFLSMPSA